MNEDHFHVILLWRRRCVHLPLALMLPSSGFCTGIRPWEMGCGRIVRTYLLRETCLVRNTQLTIAHSDRNAKTPKSRPAPSLPDPQLPMRVRTLHHGTAVLPSSPRITPLMSLPSADSLRQPRRGPVRTRSRRKCLLPSSAAASTTTPPTTWGRCRRALRRTMA